mgnify:CR=1 FL=1
MSNVNVAKAPISLERGYRPSDDEPFMNDRQREYFRRKLIVWKQELLGHSDHALGKLGEIAESMLLPLADDAMIAIAEDNEL